MGVTSNTAHPDDLQVKLDNITQWHTKADKLVMEGTPSHIAGAIIDLMVNLTTMIANKCGEPTRELRQGSIRTGIVPRLIHALHCTNTCAAKVQRMIV